MSKPFNAAVDTQHFFNDLFENAGQNSILLMDVDGIFLAVNRAFEESFGYSDADIVGQHSRILFTESDRRKLAPETEIETVLAERSAADNCFLLHKDGTAIWVHGESVLVRGKEEALYIVKVLHDIHAQKLLEKYLSESNEFIDTLFQSVSDTALLVTDSRLTIVKANPAFSRIFSLETGNMEGKSLALLDHSFWSDDKLLSKLHALVAEGREASIEPEWTTGAQRSMKLHITHKPLHQEGIGVRSLFIVKPNSPEL